MPALRHTRTYDNLTEAFARESQAGHRYLYFAQKADIEGHPELAALFRSVADGEAGHAFGHLDFLAEAGDTTGESVANLRSAIAAENYESTELYPGFADIAREEGRNDIAEWFDSLAEAERNHAERLAAWLAEAD